MIKRLLSYAMGTVGYALCSLLSIPFLTRVMDVNDYGKGRLFLVIVNFIYLICCLGMDQAIVRFYYEEGLEARAVMQWKCLLVVLAVACLLSLVGICFPNIEAYILHDQSNSMLLPLICAVGLTVLNQFMLLSLRMQNRAVSYSVIQLLNGLSLLLGYLIFYFYFHISNFWLIVYAQLSSLIVANIILIVMDWRNWLVKRQYPSKIVLKECFSYGWSFIFSFAFVWGFQNIDRLLLLKFTNYHELGIYSVAFSLIFPLVMLDGMFAKFWVPYLMENLIKFRSSSEKLLSHMHYLVMLIFSLLFLLMIVCRHLIILLLGVKYQHAMHTFVWLMFVPYFYVLSQITIAGILETKKSYWNIWIALICLLVNCLSCWLLIPRYGSIGAGMSLALTYLVFYCLRTVVSFRYISFSLQLPTFIAVIAGLCFIVIMPQQYMTVLAAIALLVVLFVFWRERACILKTPTELFSKK